MPAALHHRAAIGRGLIPRRKGREGKILIALVDPKALYEYWPAPGHYEIALPELWPVGV